MEILNKFDLRFIGNWYVDLGILGLKNLFYEVSDILNELNLELDQEKEIEFIKIFLIVYLTKEIEKQINKKIKKENVLLIADERRKFISYILKDLNKKTERKIIDNIKEKFQDKLINKFIRNNQSINRNRLLIDSDFYKNFAFFNNSQKFEKQKENLVLFLTEGKILSRNNKKDVEFQKDLNKFLPSYQEFGNFFFTKMTLNDFANQLPLLKHVFYASILTLPYAFININQTNYCFYSYDIDFSFNVNLGLKKYLEKTKNGASILDITWRSIIDVLLQRKSEWALNNMYLISYKKLSNKSVSGVEYIGISKQKARIIVDDDLREKINFNLNGKWLIMEFLKGSSLFDILFEYIKSNLDKNLNLENIYYAIAIDAHLIKASNNFKNRFYRAFNYFFNCNLVDNLLIKDDILKMNYMNRCFNNINLSNKYINQLIAQLKNGNKSIFFNNLLKIINNSEIEKNIKNLVINYILRKILYNNINWRHYALGLIIPNNRK